MRFRLDPSLGLMIGAVALATVLPAPGDSATMVTWLGAIGVAGLFFGHGASLAPQAILAGLRHWRLHLFILATTFLVFPTASIP
nr:bile acid:sodium symporter [Jiella pacifica]